MLKYILKRLFRFVVSLSVLVTLVFFALKLAGGDPATMLLNAGSSPEVLAAKRAELGLDQPILKQYWDMITRLIQGDFGSSWRTGKPITQEIMDTVPYTLMLAVCAMAVATVISVPLGMISALRKDRIMDVTFRIIALLCKSVPVFIINLAAIYIFSCKLKIFPIYGSGSIRHLILPAVTLGLFTAATLIRLVRSGTLDVIGQEYILAAKGRGIEGSRLFCRHIIPNELVSLMTIIGTQLGLLLGGSIITESVFTWPGLGRLIIQAIGYRDIPLVQSGVIIFATGFMLVNLIVDLLYPIVDPRIVIKNRHQVK